ncbi:cytochrome P450 [Streptomyces sp. NPDC127069]|uniref:cytochrome P450 n=1 Tax=Streptomyces sp. NPDC127069 TaxID=3347128 RepID=UPI00364AD778
MQADKARRSLGDEYDPFSEAHRANPHAFFERARDEAPVFYSPVLDAWVVTRHQEAVQVLRDHDRFSVGIYHARSSHHTPETRAILGTSPITGHPLVMMDPPELTLQRKILSRTFSAQRVTALESRVRRLSMRLIDDLQPLGEVDFMARFANPFPILVIGSLLGVPEADFPQLAVWSNHRTALMYGEVPPEEQPAMARSSVALEHYILDLAERRRQELGDDLASDLIRASEDEAPMTAMEVAATLRVLLTGGFETTVKLLGNTMLRLLSEWRLWEEVVAHPDRIDDVVEEELRLDGPAMSTMRRAKRPTEVAGMKIPEGGLVQVVLASANRDKAICPNGETYDHTRKPAGPHLSFGFGAHFCIGAPLALLEMRIALEQLAERLPSLRLTPAQTVPYGRSLLLRGPARLLVEWDA